MTKHTPGPWTVSGLLDNKPYLEKEMIVADGPRAIATVHIPTPRGSGSTVEECRANAQLIQAAPELTEALTELISLLDLLHNEDRIKWNSPEEGTTEITKAHTALNKAFGQEREPIKRDL